MHERALWPGNVAAAVLVIGGALIVALPQHVLTIVQLMIVTAAISAGVYALAANVPPAGWMSPFGWRSPFNPVAHPDRLAHRSTEYGQTLAGLSARRQRIEGGPPVPPPVLRLLRPLIATALDVDLRDEGQLASARDRLSAPSFALLTSTPLDRPSWFRTLRANERQVAEIVERVLDELDSLGTATRRAHRSVDTNPQPSP